MNENIINLFFDNNSLTLDLLTIVSDIRTSLIDKGLSDENCIDTIVNILERYNINCENRHSLIND